MEKVALNIWYHQTLSISTINIDLMRESWGKNKKMTKVWLHVKLLSWCLSRWTSMKQMTGGVKSHMKHSLKLDTKRVKSRDIHNETKVGNMFLLSLQNQMASCSWAIRSLWSEYEFQTQPGEQLCCQAWGNKMTLCYTHWLQVMNYECISNNQQIIYYDLALTDWVTCHIILTITIMNACLNL